VIFDLPFESYLPVASFALAAGALAVRFLVPSGTAKQALIAALLIFLVIASGIQWRNDWKEKQQVREVAEEIVNIIGNDKRTFEDILTDFRQPNYQIASAAIDFLIEEQRIGSEAATIIDKSDRQYRTRLYFVRSF